MWQFAAVKHGCRYTPLSVFRQLLILLAPLRDGAECAMNFDKIGITLLVCRARDTTKGDHRQRRKACIRLVLELHLPEFGKIRDLFVSVSGRRSEGSKVHGDPPRLAPRDVFADIPVRKI
jgi:hypothetical protein